MVAVVGASPLVRSIEFVGSRAEGRATPLSDWDFAVEADDFGALARQLPCVVEPLAPLAQQWDPLSTTDTCYMLMLPGAVKVDLIFDRPHEPEPPWTVSDETLPRIDHHFWDWTLWLGGKQAAGRHELVATELRKLHRHLLAPLGVVQPPTSLPEAIAQYRRVIGTRVDTRVGDEVVARLGL